MPAYTDVYLLRKYWFVVSVTTKNYELEDKQPSYQVHMIDAYYGMQTLSSTLPINLSWNRVGVSFIQQIYWPQFEYLWKL
jgi:hypothetical protein